jgi:hypothetical protein
MNNFFENCFLFVCALVVILCLFIAIDQAKHNQSPIDKADLNTLENSPLRLHFAYEKGMFDDGFVSNREYLTIPPESILKKIYKKDEN